MSKGSDPAYPAIMRQVGPGTSEVFADGGLTKRELFAAMAMQGILNTPFKGMACDQKYHAGDVANRALKCADALLAELAKEQTP